jgi:hypothetical protein
LFAANTSTSNSGALDFASVVAPYRSRFNQQLSSTLSGSTTTII